MGMPADVKKFTHSIEAILQTLCPGALSLHLSRIDTRARHPHESIYDADSSYFRTTQRRAFIREARCGEFDYSPSSGSFMEEYPRLNFQNAPLPNDVMRSLWEHIPRLWILVMNLGDGTHHVSTIYRGDAMWPIADRNGSDTAQFKTDAELSEALAKIQACEGFDIQAWKRFIQRYWDASVLDAAVIPANCGVIN